MEGVLIRAVHQDGDNQVIGWHCADTIAHAVEQAESYADDNMPVLSWRIVTAADESEYAAMMSDPSFWSNLQ